jgi:hypothetical protein
MAMAVAERLLVDTNALLEATDEKRSHHQEARQFIESHRGLVFPVLAWKRPKRGLGLGNGRE